MARVTAMSHSTGPSKRATRRRGNTGALAHLKLPNSHFRTSADTPNSLAANALPSATAEPSLTLSSTNSGRRWQKHTQPLSHLSAFKAIVHLDTPPSPWRPASPAAAAAAAAGDGGSGAAAAANADPTAAAASVSGAAAAVYLGASAGPPPVSAPAPPPPPPAAAAAAAPVSRADRAAAAASRADRAAAAASAAAAAVDSGAAL